MKIIESVAEWRAWHSSNCCTHKTIGFTPTLGNLHAEHQSLLTRARQECDISVLSIFINPTQFNSSVDLNNYPRTLDRDIRAAEDAGVDVIFLPSYQEIYADDYRYRVSETEFSKTLCGQHRPGHFDGVLTVVIKLLLLVKAQRAYFGEKDWQQLQLIKGMAAAFFLETEIVACPTVRDKYGLALSSRNNLLNEKQLKLARRFSEWLAADLSSEEIATALKARGFTIDYLEQDGERRYGAVYLGSVRLIDNVIIAE